MRKETWRIFSNLTDSDRSGRLTDVCGRRGSDFSSAGLLAEGKDSTPGTPNWTTAPHSWADNGRVIRQASPRLVLAFSDIAR